MSSQPQSNSNTESRRIGNVSRKGHQSGSGSIIPVIQVDQADRPLSVSVRVVPSSPYVELSSVPSVSSEYGVSSPYTNPSSYLSSPYPNPASNVEIPHTPFNFHEDSLLSLETTYKDASTPSPAPATSNTKKRNSDLGNTSCELLNGNGECSSNENSGPSCNKKIKTTSPLEPKETLFADVIALEEEQLQRNEVLKIARANIGQSRNKGLAKDVQTTAKTGSTEKLPIRESIAKQSQNNGDFMEENENNVERQLSRNDLLTDEDVAKADSNVLDALLLKQSMEETGRLFINASYDIGPETPIPHVQKLTKLVSMIIPALTTELGKVDHRPSPANAMVTGAGGTSPAIGNRNCFPVSFYNNPREYELPSPSPSPTLRSLMQGNGAENYSRNSFPVPQPCLRRTNSVQPNAIATPPFPRASVVDALGSVHSLGSSNQNGLLAGLPNFNPRASLLPSPTDLNHRPHFRPEWGVQVSQPARVAAVTDNNNRMTFHAAASYSMPAIMSQHQPQRPLERPPPPRTPLQGNQARAPQYIQTRVGNNVYSFSHSDWAEICDSGKLPKMTKTVFDKLFSPEERLNCTVSGRKSKSGLPGLDSSKMLALYACIAFLQRFPNQYPNDVIDACVYKLDDEVKKKIKIIMSQKLNAAKQQHSRRQDTP